MIKAIIFDLGGVLFFSDGGSYEGREKLAEKLGVDKKKLHDIWFKRKDLLITGKMSEEEFLKEVIKISATPLSLNHLKRSIRELNEIDNPMSEVLKKLKKNYFLAALNNEVKEWNEYRIDKFELNSYFKLIVSSCDVGVAKPDHQIYKILLDKIKIPADNLVFIDNREENLLPAKELGIKTHHFKNKELLLEWFKENNIQL
ncbi:MAG: HAD family phosphatase [Nanoarchaeota archaeon]|nr:HAD family phosphatase [Nanoarchaeota archaeon]